MLDRLRMIQEHTKEPRAQAERKTPRIATRRPRVRTQRMAPSGTKIPESEWDRIFPAFTYYYTGKHLDDHKNGTSLWPVKEDHSLDESMQMVITELGFPESATARMFKTKINTRGLRVKTIRDPEWTILDHLWKEGDQQGVDREFQWRDQKKRQKKADINKHFNRVPLHKRTLPDLAYMQQLLEEETLKVFETPRTVSASRRNATARLRREPPMTEATQYATVLSPRRQFASHGVFDRLTHLHPQRQLPGLLHQAPLDEQQRSLTVTEEFVSARASPVPTTSTSRRNDEGLDVISKLFHNCSVQDIHSKEEIKASAKACIGSCGSSEVLGDWPQVEDSRIAGQWAYCAVLYCITSDAYPELSFQHLNHATDMLSCMLRRVSACELILAGLLWISHNLSAISKEKYGQFLDRSIAVIDQDHPDNLVYGLPYKYARATLRQDEAEIQSLGKMLPQGRDQCRQIFGPESSSFLVFDYYLVSHLLEMRNYKAALAHLLDNEGGLLRKAETLAGHNDLLTLSCLTLMSRAYAGDDQLQQALLCLEDAVARSRVVFAEYNAYRLYLLDRYAALLRHTNRAQETEQILREILDKRVEVLGIYNAFVWGSLDDLEVFLERHGRPQDARQKKLELQGVFHEQNLQKHLKSSTASVVEKGAYLNFLCEFWATNGQRERANELRAQICMQYPELR